MASEVKEESSFASSDLKNDEMPQDAANIMKDGGKDNMKNESKEESGREGSDDDNEEEEDDEEEEVALLDRPVEVTGCRARKKVERLEVSFSTPKEKQEFPEGKGKKLGDCPRIEAQVQKMKAPDLKPLHKILFNRTASAIKIKKNIRKFSGFPFEKDTLEFNRKKASVEKMTASILKQVCSILDIERGGTKEEIVNRIMTFLLNPEDSGKKVLTKRKPSKEKKKNMSKKTKSEKKVKAEKVVNNEEPEESNEDDNSTSGEASMGGTDEENEDVTGSEEEPKKKSKEPIKGSKTKSKIGKNKREDKKSSKNTKRKHDEDSSASSEDEKPAKKSKMPSDDEISKLVKQILESADLQEITMKKVIKQVSDAYPDFDLSHKKAFIKSTIKSVIS